MSPFVYEEVVNKSKTFLLTFYDNSNGFHLSVKLFSLLIVGITKASEDYFTKLSL